MEMTGERRIEAPRATVWQALNDPEVLRQAIPGCESVERTGDDSFQARVAVKLGPMAARFNGKVQLTNINPPSSYTIGGEGNGGAIGFAKGGADVSLEELSANETLLKYAVKAQVGGKMAQLGARLIDSTAKQMADQFFDRFTTVVSAAPASPRAEATLPPGTVPNPTPGTEIGDAPPEARMAASMLITPPPTTTEALVSDNKNAYAPNLGAGRSPAYPPATINALSMVPTEVFGLPLTFWIGGVLWLLLLVVLFLNG